MFEGLTHWLADISHSWFVVPCPKDYEAWKADQRIKAKQGERNLKRDLDRLIYY